MNNIFSPTKQKATFEMGALLIDGECRGPKCLPFPRRRSKDPKFMQLCRCISL